METVTPKVHHHRHRRNESRQRQRRAEQQQQQQQQEPAQATEQESINPEQIDATSTAVTVATAAVPLAPPPPHCQDANEENVTETRSPTGISRTTSAGTTTSTLSHSLSQQTVLLVNGEVPPASTTEENSVEPFSVVVIETAEVTQIALDNSHQAQPALADDDEQPQVAGNDSSRNSSGDAQSLRETLQQLRPPKVSGSANTGSNSVGQQHRLHHHHHHHHHQRERERDRHHRTRSPQSPPTRSRHQREPSASGSGTSAGTGGDSVAATATTQRGGILGFMERELRQCSPTPSSARSIGGGSGTSGVAGSSGGNRKLPSSLSDDPQASPAQRSIRSRSSLDKSPRRKRSKSESRRRRERKLIAAGEMEVRQANETLMRYLKQCSEMNDASLSGELEIDQSYDERRVHRKTKSQRDKRGHLISKLYTAGGGLTSLLKELSDDIVPAEGEEIYNPFTPVVSPTEDSAPAHIDKMFLQTSSGYRPVERCYYKHHHHHHMVGAGSGGVGSVGGAVGSSGSSSGIAALIGSNARGRHFVGVGGGANGSVSGAGAPASRMRGSDSYGDDVHCLLDADECNGHEIRTNIQLACVVQRVWLLVSNVCHGLLAGLALAHLLFVLSSPHPMDWSKVIINQMNGLTNGETTTTMATATATENAANAATAAAMSTSDGNSGGTSDGNTNDALIASSSNIVSQEIMSDYAAFAGVYLNTFYCLAIVCLVSVFDRMDICRWDLSNASELISFRWLIIAMIYIATIILTICSDTIDEKLYYNNNVNVTITERELFSNSILNVWSSLSVTRSIGAICGWIMIGLTPHEDLLYEHLVDLTKYQLTNN